METKQPESPLDSTHSQRTILLTYNLETSLLSTFLSLDSYKQKRSALYKITQNILWLAKKLFRIGATATAN